VLRTVLEGPKCPVTVTVNHKSDYDDDDMKVTVDPDGRLRAVSKKIPREEVDGESIGMLLFRDSGVETWRNALEQVVRNPEALNLWYLSVVNDLAKKMVVKTTAMTGMWWQEVDEPADLTAAREGFLAMRNDEKDPVPPSSPELAPL